MTEGGLVYEGKKKKKEIATFFMLRVECITVHLDVKCKLPIQFNIAASDGAQIEIWKQTEPVYLRNTSG